MNCHPEEGGSMFIRNIGVFNHYRVQNPKTWLTYDYQQPSWKPEDLQYGASYSVLWGGCNMQHARQEKLLNAYQHFSPKPLKEDKSLNVGRCILLKWIWRTSNARMWTWIVWGIRALRKSGSFRFRRTDVSSQKKSPRSNSSLVRCYGPSRDAGIHRRNISILQIRHAGWYETGNWQQNP